MQPIAQRAWRHGHRKWSHAGVEWLCGNVLAFNAGGPGFDGQAGAARNRFSDGNPAGYCTYLPNIISHLSSCMHSSSFPFVSLSYSIVVY